jgi:hypothetical protein
MSKAKPKIAAAETLGADGDEAYRKLCTAFKAWRECSESACRRTHRCAGDPNACFNRLWPRVDEESKVWLRTAIRARAAGHTVAEATRLGQAEVVRAADHIARTNAATLASMAAEADKQHRADSDENAIEKPDGVRAERAW